MNHWLDRIPRTMRDWLSLAAGVCLIALGVSLLPEVLSGAGTVLGILAPFAFGVMLAYVLDIPTRFYAEKLFKGNRTFAIPLSYLTLLGVLVLLGALVVPQLVSSIASFVGKLPAYLQSLYDLLGWVQSEFGINTQTVETLLAGAGVKP